MLEPSPESQFAQKPQLTHASDIGTPFAQPKASFPDLPENAFSLEGA